MAIAVAVLLLLSLSLDSGDARREYVGRIPNGNNVGAAHALGHIAWDGDGPLNEFGKAFAAAGYTWTKALCQGDADGDGQTNGEELGDPCCVWRQGDVKPPLVTDVLSHPGDHGAKLNETDLHNRLRICQALLAANGSQAAGTNSSSRSNRTGDSDRNSIHPPTTALVPTPTLSSAAAVDRRSVGWGVTFAVTFILVVAV